MRDTVGQWTTLIYYGSMMSVGLIREIDTGRVTLFHIHYKLILLKSQKKNGLIIGKLSHGQTGMNAQAIHRKNK